MIVAMLGVFGVYAFPKKIPPLVVAIVGGIVYAFCLGRTRWISVISDLYSQSGQQHPVHDRWIRGDRTISGGDHSG